MSKQTRETRQKALLVKELEKNSSFFTGQDLYNKVKSIDSKIGIATVYRFLKGLKNKNHIHSYNCGRTLIYSKNKKTHCHFICEKCHKMHHIEINKLDFLKKLLNEEICHFQLDIYGICSSCKKVNKK